MDTYDDTAHAGKINAPKSPGSLDIEKIGAPAGDYLDINEVHLAPTG
jgi:hypothetical protein